jgi:molecular chaperone GrpE (heat shock protein)
MNKAILLIGLILLLGGGGTLWWVVDEMRTSQKQAEARKLDSGSKTQDFMSRYDQWLQLPEQQRVQAVLWADANGQPKTESQIHAEQQERLMADIDKLALGISGVESYADVLYGGNWRQAVDDYKQQQEQKDFIFNCSVVCTSLGGVITVLMILVMLAGLIFKGSKEKNVPVSAGSVPAGKRSVADDSFYKHSDFRAIGKNNKNEEYFGIMRHPSDNAGNQTLLSPANTETAKDKSAENQADTKQDAAITSQTILAESRREHSARRRVKTGLSGSSKQTGLIPPARQDDITAALSESELVQNVTGQDKGKTANKTLHTLMELTQQVSAIREYAANQQNRLKRFQDGYDWNIIKNFCLRIIRSIDNIESRIDDMAAQDADTSELEQIRDELVFALESSGVERFEPELNSEYRGQEKFAEALKDKCSGDSDMKGRIEKVIRPGYQCYIDENNIRVVRPAQVRLYA